LPSDLLSTVARMRDRAEEHERRMETDPAYRAEHERLEAAREADQRALDARMDAERRRFRRDRAQIPPRLWEKLDAGLDSEAAQAVARFVASDATFLVLAGKVGCGKTAAACSALDKRGGKFMKAAGVTRARFNDEQWNEVLRATVLVIDDLGTESLDQGGWAAGALAELFDHRYDWQAKTILTTNLDPDAFKARYCEADGGRFLSRLREAGVFEAIAQDSLRSRREP
jgi:DNA replication protein DnaC